MKKITLFLFPPSHFSAFIYCFLSGIWQSRNMLFLFVVSAYLTESHKVPSSDGDGDILTPL